MNNYFKPTLKNLSQGARLEYVWKLRYMSKDDVADYFDLGGEKKKELLVDTKIIVEYPVMKD